MKREIKFRVWDKGREQMWYKDTKSVDGNETILQFFAAGIGWGLYDSRLGNRLVTGDPDAIFNTPGILMQYTGIKDKNDKEVYEGDIISINKKKEKIISFFDGAFFAGDRRLYQSIANFSEIIGNIYETPQLLRSEPAPQVSDTTKED